MGTSWVRLKNECPINIKDIVRLASEVDSALNFRLSSDLARIDGARAKLTMLTGDITGLFHSKLFVQDKEAKENFTKLIEDFARTHALLDSYFEDNIKDKHKEALLSSDVYRNYIRMMKEILYLIVYKPLKRAIELTNERFTGNERDENGLTKEQFFFNAVFAITRFEVGQYSSKARTDEGNRGKGFSFGTSDPSIIQHPEEIGGKETESYMKKAVEDVLDDAKRHELLANDLNDIVSKV